MKLSFSTAKLSAHFEIPSGVLSFGLGFGFGYKNLLTLNIYALKLCYSFCVFAFVCGLGCHTLGARAKNS